MGILWSGGGLEQIDYEDTDHFQITRNFLNRRETFLDVLLAEDDG